VEVENTDNFAKMLFHWKL